MDFKEAISSQYLASLEMLKQTIIKCPEVIWNNPGDKTKCWHIAYHALFFTHLYLQDSEDTFKPWAKHKNGYQRFILSQVYEPYDKESLLEYLAFCQQQVAEKVSRLNLDAESGFRWLPFSKFELQLYNIRHLQQHTGELMERLGTRANIELDWVAMKRRNTEG